MPISQADPMDDCFGGGLSGTDEMAGPLNSFMDGALTPSPEHGQFTLSAFANPYFDSSSYSSWETSIATSGQAEVGLDISLRYENTSSVLTSTHTQLRVQSANFATAAQPIPNTAPLSITSQAGVPSLYCRPPPMSSPINSWSSPWAQAQALPVGTACGRVPRQYGLSNPTLQAPGTRQRFPDDESTVEKIAPGPEEGNATAVARSANRARHRRPQNLNMVQTDHTERKGPPRGTGIHKSSRSFSSSAPKPTKPRIPGQFVFAVEPPQVCFTLSIHRRLCALDAIVQAPTLTVMDYYRPSNQDRPWELKTPTMTPCHCATHTSSKMAMRATTCQTTVRLPRRQLLPARILFPGRQRRRLRAGPCLQLKRTLTSPVPAIEYPLDCAE